MARNFDGPPTRDEIPILRGQIFSEEQVAGAITRTAAAEVKAYEDTAVVVIQINEGAKFFASGIQAARLQIEPAFQPTVYPIRIKRTDSDSSFRNPSLVEGLPEDLDLSGIKASVHEDIVDEGRTLLESVIPHLIERGAREEDITIWTLLARKRKRDPDLEKLVRAALTFDGEGFVFGSGIDDNRLTQYERYKRDAGRGEKGIWENDPIESAAA